MNTLNTVTVFQSEMYSEPPEPVEIAEIAFERDSYDSDTNFIFDALSVLNIGQKQTTLSLGETVSVAELPSHKSSDSPDWSDATRKIWILQQF